MYTVLHGFIYEIRIRRGLCEGCREDSQPLHIEDLVIITRHSLKMPLFYFSYQIFPRIFIRQHTPRFCRAQLEPRHDRDCLDPL